MHSIYFTITSRSVSYFFRVHQFQFKTKTKLFEPLTIQYIREVTSSVTTKPNDSKQKREWEKTNSAQSSEIIWIGSKWRKINQWRCLLRTKDVKLFFLYKRTNNIEVKTQSLLQREQSNLGPLRKLCHFMIGEFWSLILSMLLYVLIAWSVTGDFKRGRWVYLLQIAWWITVFFFHWSSFQ